jgi:hypothetical protein
VSVGRRPGAAWRGLLNANMSFRPPNNINIYENGHDRGHIRSGAFDKSVQVHLATCTPLGYYTEALSYDLTNVFKSLLIQYYLIGEELNKENSVVLPPLLMWWSSSYRVETTTSYALVGVYALQLSNFTQWISDSNRKLCPLSADS